MVKTCWIVLIGHGVSFFFSGYSFFQVVLEAESIIWFVKLSLEIFLSFAIIKTLVSIVEILGMMETSASFQKQVFLFGKTKPSKVHGREVAHTASLLSKIHLSLSIIAACENAENKGLKCLFWWGYVNR